MQTVTDTFYANTISKLRKLNWKLYISWNKSFNESVSFFTIGSSTIGGIDIIKGVGDVVQEWDKYAYTDYSNRVLQFEWTREQDPYIGGAIMSIADIVLDNHDDMLTPNQPGSVVSANILPWRPVRIYAGFKDEVVPVFVGLIENMPDVDTKSKTVTIHCIDFMQSLFNFPLDTAVILQNNRTDQIISTLLQLAGLGPTQMSLDTGQTIIPFFFADKGTKLGDCLRDVVSADLGRLYMDENGIIRFINRTNWLSNTSTSWVFNRSNTIERRTTTDDNIINVVEVHSSARQVLDNQKYWQLSDTVTVPAGSSVDVWADFSDPVVTVDAPSYIDSATTSLYETSSLDTLSVVTHQYAISYLMTFTNSNAYPVDITNIELWATPVPATKLIYAREQDSDSITKYHQRPQDITNDYIQDITTAQSLALMLIQDNKDFNPVRELDIIGVPQLQVGDTIRVTDEKVSDLYSVTKIVSKMIPTNFIQTITCVKKTIRTYFRIGISTIGSSTDVIAP